MYPYGSPAQLSAAQAAHYYQHGMPYDGYGEHAELGWNGELESSGGEFSATYPAATASSYDASGGSAGTYDPGVYAMASEHYAQQLPGSFRKPPLASPSPEIALYDALKPGAEEHPRDEKQSSAAAVSELALFDVLKADVEASRANAPVLELALALGSSHEAGELELDEASAGAEESAAFEEDFADQEEEMPRRPLPPPPPPPMGHGQGVARNSLRQVVARNGMDTTPGKASGRGGQFSKGGHPGGIWNEETPAKQPRYVKNSRGCWFPVHDEEPPAKAARAALQLRQLLDFYFEPFNLQHNRYLLDLVARRVGPPSKEGPWLVESMMDFQFRLDDLRGLGRIVSAMAKIKPSQWEVGEQGTLAKLKHLRWGEDGYLLLREPPEVRSFVSARDVSHPEVVSAALRYLAAVREQSGQAPARMVSVLSYSLGDTLADMSPRGQNCHGRLKRQLLLHHTDIMCIQGMDPDINGEGLADTLIEDGYMFTTAKSEDGEANSIFWDSTRWELVRKEACGAALAVDLRPVEDPSVLLRAICMRPAVPTSYGPGLSRLFADRQFEDAPLIVGADLSLLGGAEGAVIVEEIAYMQSVMREVTGEELLAPFGVMHPDGSGMTAIQAGASGMNRLHRPDAIFFSGMSPIVALSGHTERYLSTLSLEGMPMQFPAFRIPIVCAFDWHVRFAQQELLVQ